MGLGFGSGWGAKNQIWSPKEKKKKKMKKRKKWVWTLGRVKDWPEGLSLGSLLYYVLLGTKIEKMPAARGMMMMNWECTLDLYVPKILPHILLTNNNKRERTRYIQHTPLTSPSFFLHLGGMPWEGGKMKPFLFVFRFNNLQCIR